MLRTIEFKDSIFDLLPEESIKERYVAQSLAEAATDLRVAFDNFNNAMLDHLVTWRDFEENDDETYWY